MSSHLNVFNEGILDGATCHDRPQTFTQLVGWWDILSVERRQKESPLCAFQLVFPRFLAPFCHFIGEHSVDLFLRVTYISVVQQS